MKVAVLGLGIIGHIWARHYDSDGVLAASWNRTPKPDAPRAAPSALAAAERADLIQLVVADPAAVQEVLATIAPALGPGRLVVQSSTIDPASSARFAESVTARGAGYLEAPFTGSKPAAENRQTVFYLGGCERDIQLAEPLLTRISAQRFTIGTGPQAATLKLAMNLHIACIMQGLSESLALARRAGISDDTYFQVLERNVAHSGLAALKRDKLQRGDYTPQFSVKHLHKDLRLALASAERATLPATETVRAQLNAAEERGLGDADFSALFALVSDPRTITGSF